MTSGTLRQIGQRISLVAKAILVSRFLIAPLAADVVIPSLSSPVIDQARLLSPSQRQSLEDALRGMSERAQVQIWTVPSLEGESIEGLSIRATDRWKLGSAKADNGVLIVVAARDRAARIEVGQGLEGVIPDAMAGRIIDQVMIPAFKSGQYYEGLSLAVQSISKLASGEIKELPAQRPSVPGSGLLIILLMMIVFAFRFLGAILGGPFRRRARGGYTRGHWGGGGFGGGGFGGGGWSGGGGGFSGGGASGRW